MKGFFSESNGRLSLTRLMCFLCLIMAIGLTVFSVITKQIEVYHIQIIEWLGFAFAGKVGQKIIEK